MVMWGSDSRIDARVVIGDDVDAGIVSRETFWYWRASWITLDHILVDRYSCFSCVLKKWSVALHVLAQPCR